VVGDPTEASLLVLAEKAGIKYEEVRSSSKVEDEIPFDSERKMMSILANGFLYSKGAFEVLSRKCSHVVWNGRVEKFDEEKRKAFERENEEMTGKALRVLALAFKKSGSERISEDNFTLLGLVGMIDPPREEAREAIAQCREAGIKVVMITGDNANTAKAIARELKLLESDSRVVTGAELEEMTEDELAQVVDRVSVFARVNPDHKMKIVNALKTRSHVVAMTGDGVNDAPALKKADIGIAMGITGTDVAKEASKMVLADDNFASIVRAVREGRVIFDNIVKSVKYLLSCNIGEIVAIFVGLILFPASVLLTPIQILWMNLVTDGLPALALGVDNAEPDIMRRKPRKREEDIMDPKALAYLAGIGLELGLITLGVYFLALNQTGLQQLASQGDASARAATMAFSTLVVLQLLHALNVHAGRHSIFSSRVNKFLLVAIGSAFLLQVAITEISFLTGILKTSSLGMREWVVVTAASTLIILTEEVRKLSGRLRGQETV
jgi:Ca2+-transporting ATPase